MAALPAPPPPPPPLMFSTVNVFSSNQISDIQKPVVKDTSNVQEKAGTVPLRPAQLRNYSQKWSLAGDAGLLLYLQEFSQHVLSKTTDIEKLVDNIHNSTKGSGVRIHNTFNDFLMLSSSQFIENRVYDEETVDDKNEKEPKKEKTREEIEAEIIPRFKEAVNYGFVVLDNSFITVEIKPVEDSDDEDNEVLPTHATDPIIEPKDVYGNRRLPHLIGTAEFLHDETLGLLELPSDDDEEGKGTVEGSKEHSEESSEKVSDQDSDQDSEEYSEEDQSSNDFKVENKADSQKSQRSKQEFSGNQQLDDEDDLFGEKKQSVEKDDDTAVMPKSDLQSELASKLSLGRKNVFKKSSDDEWDSKSTQEANDKSAQSISSQKITENKLNQEVFSKTNSGVKNVELHKEKRSKSKNSEKISDDEDLFGPPKQDDIFGVKENEGLFTQKKGLFSGTGNSLFDEPEEDLFTETSTKQNIQPANTSQVLTETQSVVKKIPVGGVSIFGDSGASLFHQKKESSSSSFSAGQTPAKTPVVKGLFNNDDDDGEAKKDTLVAQKTIPRKKTLEFFEDNDGDDLFGEKKQTSVSTKNNIVQPKTENILGNSQQSKEKQAPSSSNKKPFSLFDDENEDGDNDDIFSSLGKTQSKKASPIKLIGESANNKTILEDEKNQSLGKPASLITNDQSDDQLFNSKPLKKQTEASEATKKLTSFGSDSSDDDLFSIKPAAKTKEVKKETAQVIKDVPKTVVAPQKTVESHKSIKLFDDDTQDDLFSTDKIFDASSAQIPGDSLFKDTNATAKPTKPIGGVSLFGGINPLLDKKKLSASEPSTLRPAVIDDDDDDDLFSSKKTDLPISQQNSSKLANTTTIPALSKNEVIPTVSSKSNINFDGTKSDAGKLSDATPTSNKKLTPFGSDDSDDDLFTTSKSKLPAKTINAAKVVEAEPINKKEVVKTSQTVPQKSASTSKKVFSFDSSDDDLFSTKPTAKTKETAKVETVPVIKNASNTVDAPVQKIVKVESNKSLNLFDDDTQDDLFSPKKHTTKATSILPPAASSTEDIDTAAKPKKIGVSLFDGTDSLPKEKNLKTKSTLSHDVFDDEEDLFLSNKKSLPDLKFDPSKSWEKAGAVNTSDSVSADNVDSLTSISNNSPLKLPLKAESGIGKLQASLNLNPATMVPGKVPNKISSTSESVTFDKPAEVKTLENKAKTRTRGNVSRRPPSRKPHQTLDITDSFNDEPTKANIAENSSRQDENFKVLNSPLFSDSVNVVSPQGQQKFSLKNNVLFEDDNSSTLSRENVIKDNIFRNTDKEFFKKESTDDFRHHKSKATTDSSTDFVDAPSKETPPSDSFNDLFYKNDALKKNTATIEDIFSSESDLFNSSLISSRKINEGNERKTADENKKDKFSSENQTEKFVSSEKKNTPRVKKQPQVNLFGDEAGSIFDDILPSSTKKKEDKKDTWDIFGPSNDVDDIFSTPKRTTKSKKKAVKGPVKSSLNVNSASTFDDPLSGGD